MDKQYKQMRENAKTYDELKQNLINRAKYAYGKNFFEKFWLYDNFDLNNLGTDIFTERGNQKRSMPFSNEMFDFFVNLEKKPFGDIFMTNIRGKNITGVYLIAKHEDKPVLFALTIHRHLAYDDYLRFNIKLDMLVGGKDWLPLLRLDSFGLAHINYIVNGKLVENEEQAEISETPHLHRNNQETQILSWHNHGYTIAKNLGIDFSQYKSDDKVLFKKCFDFFLAEAHINAKVNEKIKDDYHFDFNRKIFSYDDLPQVEHIGEL